MNIEERAKIAVDGMRIRNDELGRGPSHDEVEMLLRRTLEESEDELLARIPVLVTEAVIKAVAELGDVAAP